MHLNGTNAISGFVAILSIIYKFYQGTTGTLQDASGILFLAFGFLFLVDFVSDGVIDGHIHKFLDLLKSLF